MYFLYISYCLPWGISGPLFVKDWICFIRVGVVQFGWNQSSGSEKKGISNSIKTFSLLSFISPWKRARSFIWTILITFHPWMLCNKFGLQREYVRWKDEKLLQAQLGKSLKSARDNPDTYYMYKLSWRSAYERWPKEGT